MTNYINRFQRDADDFGGGCGDYYNDYQRVLKELNQLKAKQQPLHGGEVCKWVDANERIPDGYGKYYFCIVYNKINRHTSKMVLYKMPNRFGVNSLVFEVLKWLEEDNTQTHE